MKNVTRRTASNKILRDKAFNVAKNPKCDGYQRGLALIVCKFFDGDTADGAIKNENMSHSILFFDGQYLGCWSCRYAIRKQI